MRNGIYFFVDELRANKSYSLEFQKKKKNIVEKSRQLFEFFL